MLMPLCGLICLPGIVRASLPLCPGMLPGPVVKRLGLVKTLRLFYLVINIHHLLNRTEHFCSKLHQQWHIKTPAMWKTGRCFKGRKRKGCFVNCPRYYFLTYSRIKRTSFIFRLTEICYVPFAHYPQYYRRLFDLLHTSNYTRIYI